jgi:undecaprenyl-diphosphatase
MDLLHAVYYGIIEGITEFLPISSTGHLMLAAKLFGTAETEFTKTFEIAIQLGAILAVVVLYPKRLLVDRASMMRIIAGFLPTAVIGLVFYKIVKTYLFGNIPVILAALAIGGVALIVFERYMKNRHATLQERTINDLSLKESALIGTMQAVAIIPGVSRSAATVIGGMLFGLSRTEAVEFSFLLAVPTMAAATGLDMFKHYQAFTRDDMTALLVGFVVAFVVALATIKWLLAFVRTHTFTSFGVYRIVIALFGVLFLI